MVMHLMIAGTHVGNKFHVMVSVIFLSLCVCIECIIGEIHTGKARAMQLSDKCYIL